MLKLPGQTALPAREPALEPQMQPPPHGNRNLSVAMSARAVKGPADRSTAQAGAAKHVFDERCITIWRNRSFLRRFSGCEFVQFVTRVEPLELVLDDLCGNRRSAGGSRLLPSNSSSADPTRISPRGRRSRPFQRGATQRYSCNQGHCYASNIWLRLRRAERLLGPTSEAAKGFGCSRNVL